MIKIIEEIKVGNDVLTAEESKMDGRTWVHNIDCSFEAIFWIEYYSRDKAIDAYIKHLQDEIEKLNDMEGICKKCFVRKIHNNG